MLVIDMQARGAAERALLEGLRINLAGPGERALLLLPGKGSQLVEFIAVFGTRRMARSNRPFSGGLPISFAGEGIRGTYLEWETRFLARQCW